MIVNVNRDQIQVMLPSGALWAVGPICQHRPHCEDVGDHIFVSAARAGYEFRSIEYVHPRGLDRAYWKAYGSVDARP